MSFIQTRKCCRIRLKAPGRRERRPDGNMTHTGRRYLYRPAKNIAYRDVHTLDPANLLKVRPNWIDVSSISHPTLHVFSSTPYHRSQPVQLPYAVKPIETNSGSTRGLRDSWPINAHGFLYFSCPLNRPQIAGELRLRVTPTNDASTFHQGKDLCLSGPNSVGAVGQPWNRPLYSLATNQNSRPLYEKLIEEGFVSPQLDKSIQSLPKLTLMYSRCQIIHALYDTFSLDLTADWENLVAVTETGISTIYLLRQFKDVRINKSPYSGTILARFEPSSLPEHARTRTVVIRIVRELTPVQCLIPFYDEYIKRPSADHLFMKKFHGKLRPWSMDIDRLNKGKLAAAGLKLVWDSTPGLARQE